MKKVSSSFFRVLLAITVVILSVVPAQGANASFDTVMVLDVSGSMDSSLSEMKNSASKFCKSILEKNSSNRIAIVCFDDEAYTACGFTSDFDTLSAALNDMYANGTTNIYDAAYDAYNLISTSKNAKNVIIMTDGYPCDGKTSSTGRYTSMYPSLSSMTYYMNPAYDYVKNNLHPIANVYAVGFFDFNTSNPSTYTDEQKLVVQFVKDLSNTKSYFPENAGQMFDDVENDVVNETTTKPPVTTTKKPVTTTKKPVTTTKKPVTTTTPVTTTQPTTVPETTQPTTVPETTAEPVSEVDVSNSVSIGSNNKDGGMSVGAKVALGTVAVGGTGGLVALLVFLLSRKPKTPIAPIAVPPVLFNTDDDDDENNPQKARYSDPAGLDKFAADSGAVNSGEYPVPSPVTTQIFGVSGSYRGANIDIKGGESIILGRDPSACSLVITDDTSKVSRVHCTVEYNQVKDCFTVTDHSKNGTFTRNTKLPSEVPTELPRGTKIQLADSSNIFKLG